MHRALLIGFAVVLSLSSTARAEVAFAAAAAHLEPPAGFMAMPTAQYVAMTRVGASVQLYAYPLFGGSPEVAAREVLASFPDAEVKPRKVGKYKGLSVSGVSKLMGVPIEGAGYVALSPHGGGVLVLAFDASGLDDDEKALAEAVAKSARFERPAALPAKTLELGGQGRGWILKVKKPAGLEVLSHESEGLVVQRPRSPHRFSVTVAPFSSPAEVRTFMAGGAGEAMRGLVFETPQKTNGGACAKVSMPDGGETLEGYACGRAVKKGVGAIIIGLSKPLYVDQKLERQVRSLTAALTVQKERVSPRLVKAREVLTGAYLLNHGGSSSNSMNTSTSSSRTEKWWFCPDGSYTWRYESVISLGQFGGRTKSDRHSGRWWMEQVGNEAQVVVQRSDTGEILRYAVALRGARIEVGGLSFAHERTSCQ